MTLLCFSHPRSVLRPNEQIRKPGRYISSYATTHSLKCAIIKLDKLKKKKGVHLPNIHIRKFSGHLHLM